MLLLTNLRLNNKIWIDGRLDFSPDSYTKPKLNSAIRVGYFPMNFEEVKNMNIPN
jgi:hypothetical protein